MDRYVGDIISDVRDDTGLQDIPNPAQRAGTRTRLFLRYINRAQEKLHSEIVRRWQRAFESKVVVTIPPNSRELNLATVSADILLGTHVNRIRLSDSTDFTNRPPLTFVSSRMPDSGRFGFPETYYRSGQTLIFSCTTTQQLYAELYYTRNIRRLRLRYGLVTAQALSGLDTTTVTITGIDVTNYPSLEEKVFCFVSEAGVVVAENVAISSVDTATGICTLQTPTPLPALSGTYVTIGRYTTTHSELPNVADEYFVEFATRRTLGRTSSRDYNMSDKELGELFEQIITLYEPADGDVHYVIPDPLLVVDDWNMNDA